MTLGATRNVGSLAPGVSNQGTTTLTIPSATAAGAYYVCAMADKGGVVTEGDETNNALCSPAPVVVPAPDLVMSAVSTSATTVAAGGSISLSNTVVNQGGSRAGAFVIGFHLSVDGVYGGPDDLALAKTRSVTSLGVGGSSAATTTLTVPAGTAAGTYYVCALPDSGGAIAESDEGNNARCTTTRLAVTP